MFIDMHCDTASRIYYNRKELKLNEFSVDIEMLKRGGSLCQFFAFFINLKMVQDPFLEFMNMYTYFKNELEKNSSDIMLVKTFNDIEKARNLGKLGALMTIEEGEALQGDIEKLKIAYNLGVRAITLTWNFKNSLGYPNKDLLYKNNGLTEKGLEFIYNMEKLGMIPDCSHLSDAGFYDLVRICKKPFVATHSNSREITNHPRNLTDNMIKCLGEKGGVTGINFYSGFLGESDISRIEDMVKHIMHIRNVGGVDILALGSDFDGIDNEVEVHDASEFWKLENALKKNGINDDEIDKIFYKNVLRVIKECI